MKKVVIAIMSIALLVMASETVKSPKGDATTTVTKVATESVQEPITKVANKDGGEKVKPTKISNKNGGKKDKQAKKRKQKKHQKNHGATPKNNGSVDISFTVKK